jgi:hypothetical protein
MKAEYTFALILAAAVVGFIVGDLSATRRERYLSQRRVDGLRRWYVGSLRDW